jgi:DNA modification methylase
MLSPYYESGGITIYHGEAAQIIPYLQPVDLLLTDPPYGIGEAAGKNKSRCKPFGKPESRSRAAAISRDYGNDSWDDKPIEPWLIDMARAKATWQIIFGGNYYAFPPTSCWLVWDKDNGNSDFADCELAWTNLKKAVRKLRWRWNGMLQEHGGIHKETRWHPTQKPLEVMKWALSHAPEDVKTILDPFMGSGTSLLAAKELGRCAVGIEREERYCEAAVKRLAQENLFGGTSIAVDRSTNPADTETAGNAGEQGLSA